METLEIEDLKHLLGSIQLTISNYTLDYEPANISLKKSRSIIEQMIKDREFEQSQTTLPKL